LASDGALLTVMPLGKPSRRWQGTMTVGQQLSGERCMEQTNNAGSMEMKPWQILYEQLSALEALYVVNHQLPKLNQRAERILRYLQRRRRRDNETVVRG
jgi:hypothetical protein